MFALETVRELCERCLVNPFDNGAGELEVTWANTHLPLHERLQHLDSTKPWQLGLKKGKEVLEMTVPAQVSIRVTPARSKRSLAVEARAGSRAGGQNAEAPPGEAPVAEPHVADKPPQCEPMDASYDARVEIVTHAEEFRPVVNDEVGSAKSEAATASGETETREIAAIRSGETEEIAAIQPGEAETNDITNAEFAAENDDAAEEEDDHAAALAAAGLMAVAAGAVNPTTSKKRGRGRPRRMLTQEESDTAHTRGVGGSDSRGRHGAEDTQNPRGGAASTPTHYARGLNPVLRAAYETGRAEAAARAGAFMSAGGSRGVGPGPGPQGSQAQGPSAMSIADIVGKFYNYKPSIDGPRSYPLTSFGVLGVSVGTEFGAGAGGVPVSGGGTNAVSGVSQRTHAARAPAGVPLGVPLGVGPESFNAGSAANNEALWQWQNTLAALSGRAGHPPGVFAVDANYASLFAPPVTTREVMEVRLANERAFAELCKEVEDTLVAATTAPPTPTPSAGSARSVDETHAARAALCVRVEKVLRQVSEKRADMNTTEKGKLASGVVALQAWVKTQLQQRIEELTARAWDRDGDVQTQTPGKSHKGAFAALATVAEASEAQHVERAVAPVNVDGDARSE